MGTIAKKIIISFLLSLLFFITGVYSSDKLLGMIGETTKAQLSESLVEANSSNSILTDENKKLRDSKVSDEALCGRHTDSVTKLVKTSQVRIDKSAQSDSDYSSLFKDQYCASVGDDVCSN